MPTTKKTVFVIEYKFDNPLVTQFQLTIKEAMDIHDAIYQASDAVRGALNLGPYDDLPLMKSVSERGW